MTAGPGQPRRAAGNVFTENIREALTTVRSHKMRSSLVILGVAIGVTTLMAMVSILTGLMNKIRADVSSSDNVVVNVQKFDFLGGEDPEELLDRADLTPEEFDAVRTQLPSVRMADFQQQAEGRLYLAHYQGNRTRPMALAGTSQDFGRIYVIPIAVGRLFTETEIKRKRRVCILGKGALEDLFPAIDPVGKRIRFGGKQYEVIGAFQSRESLFGSFADNFILIPYTSYRKDYARPERDSINFALVPAVGSSVEQVMDDVRTLLRGRRKLRPGDPDDFALIPADRIQSFVDNVTQPVGLALVVIASIGLMVGGIGVMAIMLVSVTERTREIGIRKAVGAKRTTILAQFLTEAMTLTGIGGIVGILAGLVLARAVALLIGLPVGIPVVWIVASVGVSAGVGLVFGMYPAARAARLDPVDAIRHE